MAEITLSQAIHDAIAEEMRRDPTVVIIGEAVGPKAYGSSTNEGLFEEFGPDRVRQTGIIETVIGGGAVGAALAGLRPIAEFLQWNFAVVDYDGITGKGGIWGYEHGGNIKMPVVFKGSFGGYGGGGAEHSRALTAAFWHIPGLKIVVPTTPYDAKGLMKAAIRDDNAVCYFFHAQMGGVKGEVPEGDYVVPLGQATVRREGTDCTIVAVGYQVTLSLKAAEDLAKEGISVEVIDPRSLEPLDIGAIEKSVRKTGRLVVVDEDWQRCGVGAEIGFQIQERAFDALKAPVQRVDCPNIPHPVARVLVNAVLPTPDKIAKGVKNTLGYKK